MAIDKSARPLALYVLGALGIILACALATCAEAQEQRPLIPAVSLGPVLNHTSNYRASNRSEISNNFVGIGLELKWKAVEVTGALGKQQLKGPCEFCGDAHDGGYLGLRWMPLKLGARR